MAYKASKSDSSDFEFNLMSLDQSTIKKVMMPLDSPYMTSY